MKRTGQEETEKIDSFPQVVAAALALVFFGVVYAQVVNKLERSGHMEHRSSLFVAFGTLATLFVRYAIMPLGETRLKAMGYAVAAFSFSGVPMLVNQMLTKTRVDTGFRSRLKDREWIVSRNGHRMEPR
ncbi:MAG: hypothetical protein V9G98_22565 [Candidatus Competibacter sp.]